MKLIYDKKQIVSARKETGDALFALGERFEDLWVLTPDIGVPLRKFEAAYPDRYLDLGIAEQNTLNIAAGLALEGDIPVIYGMLPFLDLRSAEQLRNVICYQNLPVRIIATGGGLVAPGGSTHLSIEDIAVLKSFVNLTVIAISDPHMIVDVLNKTMDVPGPVFIRLGQGAGDPRIYDDSEIDFEIGKGISVKEGDDLTIFTYGPMVGDVLDAAEYFEEKGVKIGIVDMFTLKPLDEELILNKVRITKKILVVEDHLMSCGLANSIADLLIQNRVYPEAFERMGIPEVYAGFGSRNDLHKKYGYDKDSIIAKVEKML